MSINRNPRITHRASRQRRRSVPRVALSLALLGTVGVPLLATNAAPASAATPLGIPGCGDTHLLGVSMGAAKAGWAVGYTFNGHGLEAIILRWNGTTWQRATVPKLGRESYLYAVSALSPTKAFAVGIYGVGNQFRTLVLSWDGTRWTRTPSPNPNSRDNDLYGVSYLAADDAWTVGAYGFSGAKTLALHWDGSSWKQVTTPNPTTFDFLQSVDGSSSDDVWAVGASDDGTLALHWDGSTWQRVASFGGGVLDIMFGVSASSSHDVWGVGNYGSHQPPYSRALAEHWNGTAWKNVSTVNPGHRNNVFNGVDALANDDVWAVGAARDRHITTPIAEHWNGASWQQVDVEGTRKALTGVSAVASDDVWAVGNSNGGAQCLIEHWDGSDWSRWSQ